VGRALPCGTFAPPSLGYLPATEVLAHELVVAAGLLRRAELVRSPRGHPRDGVGEGENISDIVARHDYGAALFS
jgi:hypothetical protein